jgi:hypothetical protein
MPMTVQTQMSAVRQEPASRPLELPISEQSPQTGTLDTGPVG